MTSMLILQSEIEIDRSKEIANVLTYFRKHIKETVRRSPSDWKHTQITNSWKLISKAAKLGGKPVIGYIIPAGSRDKITLFYAFPEGVMNDHMVSYTEKYFLSMCSRAGFDHHKHEIRRFANGSEYDMRGNKTMCVVQVESTLN